MCWPQLWKVVRLERCRKRSVFYGRSDCAAALSRGASPKPEDASYTNRTRCCSLWVAVRDAVGGSGFGNSSGNPSLGGTRRPGPWRAKRAGLGTRGNAGCTTDGGDEGCMALLGGYGQAIFAYFDWKMENTQWENSEKDSICQEIAEKKSKYKCYTKIFKSKEDTVTPWVFRALK